MMGNMKVLIMICDVWLELATLLARGLTWHTQNRVSNSLGCWPGGEAKRRDSVLRYSAEFLHCFPIASYPCFLIFFLLPLLLLS